MAKHEQLRQAEQAAAEQLKNAKGPFAYRVAYVKYRAAFKALLDYENDPNYAKQKRSI